ncbi:MAG: hypothetical protein AB7R89_15315 [Dehalococcoidia bacterium]
MVEHANVESAVGKDLYTHNGDHLGTVKEVRGGLIKVDAPLQPDYWLSASAIDQPLGNGLAVTFAKDELSEYKVDAPDPAEDDRGAAGYKPTTVPYSTGFTAGLADKDWPEAEPMYRQEWEQEHATPGQSWDAAAPGYRYAHGMSREPNLQGRSWEEVADELEARYVAWSIDEGYAEPDRVWTRSGPYTREAWIMIWRSR